MENPKELKKIAHAYYKSPKVLKKGNMIIIQTERGRMELEAGEYDIFDKRNKLLGGGDYDDVMEAFDEMTDLLGVSKVRESKEITSFQEQFVRIGGKIN
jgi:hypothetical protein